MAIVRYLVNDVDQALPVYLALGFTVKERWGSEFAILELHDLQLWLSGPGTSASQPLPSGPIPMPGGWNRLVVEVPDVGAAVLAARAAGARVRSELIQGVGGNYALVEDASRNPLELIEINAIRFA